MAHSLLLLVSFLKQSRTTCLRKSSVNSGVGPPTSVNNRDNSPTHVAEARSSIEGSLSRVILVCVKLKMKTKQSKCLVYPRLVVNLLCRQKQSGISYPLATT